MNPNEYQGLALRTECHNDQAQKRYDLQAVRVNHALIGMTGEIGEIAGAVEKWLHYGNKPLDVTNIKEELGDMFWYMALMCDALNIDLSDVMAANIRKLRARYPEKFSEEKAQEENRDRGKEAEALTENIVEKVREDLPPPKHIPPLTQEQVIAAQATGGCCERFANQMACVCLLISVPNNYYDHKSPRSFRCEVCGEVCQFIVVDRSVTSNFHERHFFCRVHTRNSQPISNR